jgi:cellulose synthase/poly-beta-1,6-N-acetylglucosamine synthase-like glycosyltransferase
MSVYNEEKYIEEKISTLLSQNYDGQLEIYIGSDDSSDKTNEIVEQIAQQNDKLHFIHFEKRRGKPSVINDLHELIQNDFSKKHIYVLTDANVMLAPNVISIIVSHFKNEAIGLVDAHMTYSGVRDEGISTSENTYLNGEVKLKHNESKVTKKMIGPFGGCYALRSELYISIPSHFLVDDFYLAMNVFSEGYLAINDLSAICREPVTHHLLQEYGRKKRIAAGNFQNLFHYVHLFNPLTKLGLSLISHKLIRWIGPFLILLIIGSCILLAAKSSAFYFYILLAIIIWAVLIPMMDFVLSKLKINVGLLRSISYFNLMNVALLAGFFKYISGVKEGTWNRTER